MESLKFGNKKRLMVDLVRCRACAKCLARRVCRSKALVQVDPGEPPFVDPNRCYGCLLCVVECPFDAIIPY